MFNAIGNFFRGIKISFDFDECEKQAKQEHLREAESHYAVSELESKRSLLLMSIDHKANTNYGYAIEAMKKVKADLESQYNEKNSFLILLTRDYRAELQSLYDKKEALYAYQSKLFTINKTLNRNLKQAFDEKRKAFQELDECRAELGWFRNRYEGYDLPSFSFLGPTLGDLEKLKDSRNNAYDATLEAKDRVLDLKARESEMKADFSKIESELIRLNNQIQKVKDDRSKKFKIKESGIAKQELRTEIVRISDEKDKAHIEIKRLERQMTKFIQNERDDNGLNALEMEIELILKEKEQFIKSFDIEENRLKRKEAHRIAWLKKNT